MEKRRKQERGKQRKQEIEIGKRKQEKETGNRKKETRERKKVFHIPGKFGERAQGKPGRVKKELPGKSVRYSLSFAMKRLSPFHSKNPHENSSVVNAKRSHGDFVPYYIISF